MTNEDVDAWVFIEGDWTEGSGPNPIVSVNPATEEVIGSITPAGELDMLAAVASARRAFDSGPWSRTTVSERAEFLRGIANGMRKVESEMAHALTDEMGSPITQSLQAQIPMAIGLYEYYADLAESTAWVTTQPAHDPGNSGFDVLIEHLPVGVTAAIIPWNGPHIIAAMKLAPALAAGCTVILKPSPEATRTFRAFGNVLKDIGLPPGVVSIVPAHREESEFLVRAEGLDKVSFTGSTAAGRKVAAIAAQRLVRCTTELGGKSAAILLDDADLDTVLPQLAPAMTFINGQACNAPTRILVPRSRYDEMSAAIVGTVRDMASGDPSDEATVIGPVASKAQLDRVEMYLDLATEEGATLALGGRKRASDVTGWYIEPTVFTDVDNSMRVAQEEIFGPVFCVLPYEDDDEAVSIANDSEYGLAGSVWGSDIDRATSIARRIRAGAVNVNTHGLDAAAPLGGFKQSGIGRERGAEGLLHFTETRSTMVPRS